MSRSNSAARSSGPYTGLTGMPACSLTSFIASSPSSPELWLRREQECLDDRQHRVRSLLHRSMTDVGKRDDLGGRPLRPPARQVAPEGRVLHAPHDQRRHRPEPITPLPQILVPRPPP